ncbi:MAG: hypothetical protein GWO40_05465 [Gammaproteobacteria bacterium]|nr:hypothetical protein [Gammaproteobacteria bacterium]NIR90178.1 hypothetical protein [Gammaproteobacteria bacterium]NIU03737.1 hypothetical protein [Gammaproteobacteria bacterium]NIV51380.1 hypothetical protein [Gammaproteobacteria bacterium]NIX85011.1 hypothetical protein [Gammaproteobacteria bacterium]
MLTPRLVPTDKKIAGVPMGTFVKGGTTTSAWDKYKARQYKQSDAHRRHQDRQRDAVKAASRSSGVRAALHSMQLSRPDNPRVCLLYKARDSALDRQSICELVRTPTDQDEQAFTLVLVCPKCLERTGRQDDAQIMVNSMNKRMWLDESKRALWVDQESGMSYMLAGTITTGELCHCTALGCDWKFRIDDSVLYGSHHYNL